MMLLDTALVPHGRSVFDQTIMAREPRPCAVVSPPVPRRRMAALRAGQPQPARRPRLCPRPDLFAPTAPWSPRWPRRACCASAGRDSPLERESPGQPQAFACGKGNKIRLIFDRDADIVRTAAPELRKPFGAGFVVDHVRPSARPARSRDVTAMKLVIAIIKPFKLEEVRDALTAHRRARHDRHRGQGLRPAEGPHRNLSRRRIRRELPAQDEDRGRRSPTTRPTRSWRRSPTPPRPARSATARFSSPTSIAPCASAPARPTTTRSENFEF